MTAPTPNPTDLGAFLRTAREAMGLSNRGLAALSGIDQATIGRIESGFIARPTASTLARLAAALKVETAELYAKAEYLTESGLPTFRPYMRTKYGQLPEEDIERIEAYAARIAKRHGISLAGPAPGEDEELVATPRRARKKST